MKKIILYFTAVLFLFVACEKTCGIKPPKNIKSIDWENYNDVYTVYWNTIRCCDETISLQSYTIMISGWTAFHDAFYLYDDTTDINGSHPFPFVVIESRLPEFKNKMDTSDLTKKCYIKGNLIFSVIKTPQNCVLKPVIEITNIDDIYFK